MKFYILQIAFFLEGKCRNIVLETYKVVENIDNPKKATSQNFDATSYVKLVD